MGGRDGRFNNIHGNGGRGGNELLFLERQRSGNFSTRELARTRDGAVLALTARVGRGNVSRSGDVYLNYEEPAARRPTVLVIDDDADTVHVYSDLLGGRGFAVEVCRDGSQVVSAALAAQPDVILMDFLLPGSNGWDATRALKQDPATMHVPVIGISAYGDPMAREIALRAGCVDYFEKPVSPMVVLHAVRSLVNPAALPMPEGVAA